MSTASFMPADRLDDADHKFRSFEELHPTFLHLQLYLPMCIGYSVYAYHEWKDCTPEEQALPNAQCGWVATYNGCKPDQFGKDRSSCPFEVFFETPPDHLCRNLLIFMFAGIVLFWRSSRKLKKFAFCANTVVTIALRILTWFSAAATETSSVLIIWNSNSYWKPLFIWFVIELWVWEWSYLGTSSDTHFNPVLHPSLIPTETNVLTIFRFSET